MKLQRYRETFMKEIKPMDGTAVRCEAGQCEMPALFLFVGAGPSGGRWAYCDEHATKKAAELNLEMPRALVASAATW
jgi:hypothetical protein